MEQRLSSLDQHLVRASLTISSATEFSLWVGRWLVVVWAGCCFSVQWQCAEVGAVAVDCELVCG